MRKEIRDILKENDRRNSEINKVFDPVSGEGSIGERTKVCLSDYPTSVQYLPTEMLNNELVKKFILRKSIRKFIEKDIDAEYSDSIAEFVIRQFIRVRIKYDFPFWAYMFARIKPKEGGEDIPFKLNRAQRRLTERLEAMRKAGNPIRLILLKARQWGGSTLTQIYMAWLQLVHKKGLNSLIVGHQKDSSSEVKGMFDKLINAYPTWLLHEEGEAFDVNEKKITGFGTTQNINLIPSRNAKIKIGTAEKPDSARGGDSSLIHCTEIAFWKKTEGKTPEEIVRAACSGTTLDPLTMIVKESTANGTGNYFHEEYLSAKEGKNGYEALFIPWYYIEKYSKPIDDVDSFATWLYENKDNSNTESDRMNSGQYYWKLWNLGATLEAIRWYIDFRASYKDHADMAAEYPSDDTEAFKHSGANVFDDTKVEKFMPACCAPKFVGSLYADDDEGTKALSNLRFIEDKQGQLWIWKKPEADVAEKVVNRYLVVVDVGGRANKSDWSVIVVYDRLFMMEGGKPSVVAQWYGHIDHDVLAWKAAQIAKYYNDALLVIESNTLETKDRDHILDGDQTGFILNQIKEVYDNLYARKQSEEDIAEGREVKYGFHTNVSTKPMIISFLIKVVREHLYTERDERCLHEYNVYERKQNGSYGAVVGEHDDLLMTRAIGMWICFREMELPRLVTVSNTKASKITPTEAVII